MTAIFLSLTAILLSAGNPPGGAPPPLENDPPVVKRAQHQAKKFLRDWRSEWKKGYLHVGNNPVRDAAAHCHFDGTGRNHPPNIIVGVSSKSQCPTWLPRLNDMWDERIDIDRAIRNEGARAALRHRRAQLLLLLDSALTEVPDHPLIRGQLVRFAVDQRDSATAWRAVAGCRDQPGWCLLLGIYVAASFHQIPRADSLAGHLLAAIPASERCSWGDVPMLLSKEGRSEWARRSCESRRGLERTFWWLADPFWSIAGNERRAEHFARLVTVKLRSDLRADEWYDYGPRVGGDAITAMIVRYGWPTFMGWQGNREDIGHRSWLGFYDQAVPTTSPEYQAPRAHTLPPWHAIASPATLRRDDFRDISPGWKRGERFWDAGWWTEEHMPLRVAGIVPVSDQTVFFRRAQDALLALATQLPRPDSTMEPGARYSTALVIAGSPDSSRVVQPRLTRGERVAYLAPVSEPQLLSIEMLPDGSRMPAGRSRFAVLPAAPLSELPRGEIALSDIALYDARGDEPANLDQALALMFPSNTVPAGVKLGLYWEAYGLPEGEPVDVELRVEHEADGLLRRIAAITGLSSVDHAAVNIRWRIPGPGGLGTPFMEGTTRVQPHTLAIDARSFKRGRYSIILRFTRPGAPSATSIREFEVK